MDINILSEEALEKRSLVKSLKTFYSIMRIPSMFVSILSIGYFFEVSKVYNVFNDLHHSDLPEKLLLKNRQYLNSEDDKFDMQSL